MSELQFTVPAEQSGKRIDSWLAEQIEGLTRSAAQNLLSEQAVTVSHLRKITSWSVARRLRFSFRS